MWLWLNNGMKSESEIAVSKENLETHGASSAKYGGVAKYQSNMAKIIESNAIMA
jgi:hypothetical protein